MGDVFEERQEIDFLLVVTAQGRELLLADDRDHRLVVELGVIQAVQQMYRARAGRGEAHADFAGELRVRARLEGRELLVARLHELNAMVAAIEGAHDSIDAVSRITVNTPHTPGGEALQ